MNSVPPPSHSMSQGTAQSGLTVLAGFLHKLRHENLPAPVLARASLMTADSIGVIAAGMREPEMQHLAAQLVSSRTGHESSVIGHAERTTAEVAAFLHGTAGTFLELDEGNRFSRGHPGIHVLPVALAIAQREGSTGAQLLAAVIAGYEVAARIGAACEIRTSMHPHGTWGMVGGAVAVRKLLGGSAQDFERTINVASTLGLATSVSTMRDGATVRNAFAGVSGKTALVVHDLVDAGFTGEADGLTAVYDGVVAHSFRWEKMLEGLGERWEIERNYFKLHACCRFNHAALDALAQALEGVRPPLVADEIDSIEVQTYSLAARLVNARPANALAAKYSLPFAMATALVNRSTGVEAFSEAAVRDPSVLRLAQKVRVREDSAMTQRLPHLRQARVILRLSSGTQCSGLVHTNRGDSESPLDDGALSNKFMTLTAGTWSSAEASRLHQRLLALDAQADLSALFP